MHTLGLQIAQSRAYLYTLGPKVGLIYMLGASGIHSISRVVLGAGLEPYQHPATALEDAPNTIY